MGILSLKSNLTKYDPTKLKEENVDPGRNKLKEIEQKDYMDLSKLKSNLSMNTNKETVVQPKKTENNSSLIDKNWMKEKELFGYNSAFTIDSTNNELINPNKSKLFSLDSKLDNNIVRSTFSEQLKVSEYVNELKSLRRKDSDYNLDDYKRDIVTGDLASLMTSEVKYSKINRDLVENSITRIVNSDPTSYKTSYSIRFEDVYKKASNDLKIKSLDTLFNNVTKLVGTNLVNKQQLNSDFDFDDKQSTNGFVLDITSLNTSYNVYNSRYSNRYNNVVDNLNNIYSSGFSLKQTDSLYKEDSSDLTWKKNKIPSVNYLDIKNENQMGLVLNPESLKTNFNVNSSKFVWKDLDIPSVNYLDINKEYQEGFNLRTSPLLTYYNPNSSKFDWNGNTLDAPEVNYFDRNYMFTKVGYQKFTPFKVSDYIKDASEFDWNGSSLNAPEVNYFDRNYMFTKVGYQKFTPFKVSDYIKDASEFDWNGSSLNAPEVNYFDRNFMFTNLGYQKFTPFKVSDYIKDASEFDWNGESLNAPEVDYFDQTKQYTAFGYQKFTPFKVSDYIKDASEFDWNGTSVNAPEVDYFDQTKQYTAFGYQKFTPFKVSDYIKDASEFDWNGESLNAPEVNYLDSLRRHTIFGFQKLTPMYVSDYRKDASRFDWDGETKDAPEVDYFDQNKRNTTRGYQKFTPFKVTDYLKDTSAFVWSATSLDGPEVDYFDQNKINTTVGYKKLTRMYISDYLKDSSNFDWDGDTLDAPEVNYFDRNRVYTVKGYQKLVSMLSSDYIPDSSKFDFDGNNLNAPEVNYFDRNRVYTLRGYQKLVPMLSSDYVPDSSRFDFDGGKLDAPEVNYFDVLNRYQLGFNKYAPAKISNYVPNASDFDNQELEKYRIDNKYEVLGSIYEMDPRFNSRYKEVYTKIGDARDNSYNIDLFWDEPYVIRGVGNFDQLGPEYYGIAGIRFDEGLIRGGATTYASRVIEDVQRLGKYLTSTKGLLFTARQIGMQLTNPNVEKSTNRNILSTLLSLLISRPTQVYLPTATLLSAKGIIGPLFPRHSFDPFGIVGLGRYGEIVTERNLYSNENRNLRDQDEDSNRLLILTKELFPNWLSDGFRDNLLKIGDDSYYGKEIEYLSYSSGPNSFYGFGSTNIKRYSVTNILSTEQIFTGNGPMYPAVSYHRFTSDRQYASSENNNLAVKAEYTKNEDVNDFNRVILSSPDTRLKSFTNNIDMVTLSGLITDLEKYKISTSTYHIPSTTHKVNTPFKTFGTLSYPNSDQTLTDKYKYSSNQTRANELRQNRNDYKFESKMEGLIETYDLNSYIYDSNYGNSGYENYVGLSYDDISFLASSIRGKTTAGHHSVDGSFSLLKQLDKEKFEKYIEADKTRLHYINGLFLGEDTAVIDTDKNAVLATINSLGSHGSRYKDGQLHRRNNKYSFDFPRNGESVKIISQTGGLFDYARKTSKGDTVNLIDVVRGYSKNLNSLYKDEDYGNGNASDFIKLVFSTANYNQVAGGSRGIYSSILPFRATLKSLSDTFSPTWNPNSIIGRGDQAYMYSGYERGIRFDFIVVATTLEEHYTNWRKLNELASFTTPDYGIDGNQRMLGPVLRLTVGDLYVGVPGFITSLDYEYDFSSNVEIAGYDLDGTDLNKDKMVLALPGIIKVSVGYKIIGNHRPEKSGKIIELTSENGGSWTSDTPWKPEKREKVEEKPIPPITPVPPDKKPPLEVTNEPALAGVGFASGTADLDPGSKAKLDSVAEQLKANPSVKIELIGHTDNTGIKPGSKFKTNQQLSEARAKSVKAYLQSKGVTNDITAVGKGDKEPVASNETEPGRVKNRRVEMKKISDQSGTAKGNVKF